MWKQLFCPPPPLEQIPNAVLMWHYKNTPGVELVQASTLYWHRLCAELPAITEVGLGTTVAAEGLVIVKRLISTAPSSGGLH